MTDQTPAPLTAAACEAHVHVASEDDGCADCGHDLRALCHLRDEDWRKSVPGPPDPPRREYPEPMA